MRQVTVRLDEIAADQTYLLSCPHNPERYEGAAARFPGLPLLVVDRRRRVVCGHDYLQLLRQRGEAAAEALRVDLDAAGSLLLNFNLTDRLFGLNLCEKLIFVRKITPLLPLAEVRRRAELGFALNEPLLRALDTILSAPFRPVLADGRLGLRAALQLAGMGARDRRALLGVFRSCGFSESQQGLVAQWLEEIAFRDKKPVAALLGAGGLASLLAGEMPQKRFLDALHALRFPALAQREREWRAWQKKAAAASEVSLSHAPLFAREEVRLALTLKNRAQAEELLARLKKIP